MSLLEMKELCAKHRIVPRGILHVGAHHGQEIEAYRSLGLNRNIVFVEANPTVCGVLRSRMAGEKGVQIINRAISDKNGTIELNVTTNDQCSSILPLKRHLHYSPDIVVTRRVSVPSCTLDSLAAELELSAADYNVLSIDIQGAELIAFREGTKFLKQLDAIFTEVNFEELYEGCAQVGDLDTFLGEHGFARVETTAPSHPSWGDALYIRKQPPAATRTNRGVTFTVAEFAKRTKEEKVSA
jgi:FkbM family methyltransferase